MFAYDVMSEDEAQKAREFPMLPDGVYDFETIEAKLTYSQAGNPMIQLKNKIVYEGRDYNVYDNLIGTKNMVWKTKHYCESTGLEREYLAGTFSEKLCMGRRGVCEVGTKPERPKNDGTNAVWKAKNEVVDYQGADTAKNDNPFAPPKPVTAPIAPAAAQPQPPESEPFHNDDIPF